MQASGYPDALLQNVFIRSWVGSLIATGADRAAAVARADAAASLLRFEVEA